MRIFVVADTHFGHKALSETLNVRPDDFENRLTNAWRATITEKDLVIHLGDVVVGKPHHWFDQLAPLPGRKILVQGNHDCKSYTWCMNNGFDFVCHCFNWKIFGLDIAFSHEPLTEGNHDLNIHGHLHLGSHHPDTDNKRFYLVSMESNGYRPEKLETIVRIWKKMLNISR